MRKPSIPSKYPEREAARQKSFERKNAAIRVASTIIGGAIGLAATKNEGAAMASGLAAQHFAGKAHEKISGRQFKGN